MMNNLFRYAGLFSFSFLLLSCGGGESSSDDGSAVIIPPANNMVSFTLGLSDAPVDDADEVIITIESITFKKENGDEVVFDTFNNDSEGIVDAETITLDLLKFQGGTQFNVLENATIEAGQYNQVIINVNDEDITKSYVTEIDGAVKSIKVPSNSLKLGGITFIQSQETQAFTIEFNLRKSMTYKPGPQEYNLKPTGVRLVDNSQAGTISGTVDINAINLNEYCIAENHLIYLYQGQELDASQLADSFDSDVANNGAPEGAIAPLDSVSPTFDNDSQSYRFEFGFVPSGDYTLVYACNTGENGDDPDVYDAITLPNPASELITLSVENKTTFTQNFPIQN